MKRYKCPICDKEFNCPGGGCPRVCPKCGFQGGCDGFEEIEK